MQEPDLQIARAEGPGLRRFAGQTLTVAYIFRDVAEDLQAGAGRSFEAATGARVEWLVAPVEMNILALLAAPAAKPPFDAIITHVANTVTAIARGLIAKLDYANISNIAQAVPAARTDYAAGLWYFVAGLCYHVERYREHGIPQPTSLESLFNPLLAGRVALPASTTTAPIDNLIPAFSEHYGTPLDDPGPLMERFSEIKPCGYFRTPTEVDEMLSSGEAWFAYHTYWDCRRLNVQGVPVEMAPYNLRIRGNTYAHWGVLTGLQCTTNGNRELCEIFANFLLDPSGAGLLPARRKVPFPVTVPAAQRTLLADSRTATMMYPTPERLYEPPLSVEALYHRHRAKWLAAWTEFFA